MNNGEMMEKVHVSVDRQSKDRGYATVVDVLLDIGVLTKAKLGDWRFGRAPYLEAVCTCNLNKLNLILKEIKIYSEKLGFKPSFCYYKRWGTKKKLNSPLRFTKSGNPVLEKAYATHYVNPSLSHR